MGCSTCADKKNGLPKGCKSNGSCQTGNCNKLNTFDWLSGYSFGSANDENKIVEISFKKGARKEFCLNASNLPVITGDYVAIETEAGFDVGEITLSGPLVSLQMKKKKADRKKKSELPKIIREATEQDFELREKAISKEQETMVRSRAIARSLKLDMKIGDVEIQADSKKITFYYTAEGRVDFRELIKEYAREFRARIEMRQIGARQEAALVGGLGSCGRELCCSTWLTNFKSVTTEAARYQNLSINQAKLSGQCGRLKCCLNYELDTYMDALEAFPKQGKFIHTEKGKAVLQKTDIFKQLMWYSYEGEWSKFIPLHTEKVKELLEKSKQGEKIPMLEEVAFSGSLGKAVEKEKDYDLVGHISLESLEKASKKKKRKKKRKPNQPSGGRNRQNPKNKRN